MTAAAKMKADVRLQRGLAGLSHQDPLVRKNAAVALGQLGDPGAIPALLRCIKDKQSAVSFHCMRALGALKAKEAVGPLTAEVSTPNAHRKAAALSALGGIGSREAYAAVAKELGDLRSKKAKGVRLDQHLLVEEEAIRALGAMGMREAAPLVRSGLNSPDDRIKAVSCRSLAQLDDKADFNKCLGLLSHSEAGIRREIAEALAEWGDASARPAIEGALVRETNPMVARVLESARLKLGGAP